jgi:uncharacterized damage-inducible protein DinB
MEPKEALTMLNLVLANADQEAPVTRKVIAAVPAGKEDYSPDPKSMNALKLAWHIASSDVFFMNSIADRKFARGEAGVPAQIKSAADVAAWYDANRPAAVARLKAMSGEDLAKPLDFMGVFTAPAVTILTLGLRHVIHHRGQLSVYLRPMGAKVPSIYGPSGDEPMA